MEITAKTNVTDYKQLEVCVTTNTPRCPSFSSTFAQTQHTASVTFNSEPPLAVRPTSLINGLGDM